MKAIASLALALLGSVQLVNALAATKRATCAGGQTVTNAACCVLFPLLDEIQDDDLLGGECGDAAHAILRMAFHDAIAFSPTKGGGGADGSLITFNATELEFQANGGLDDALAIFADNILAHPEISPGDYIQFVNAVGLTNCPGAPRISFFLGRPPPKAAAPDGLVPLPFAGVQSILARMADAGFSPAEVIALLASHSVAGADTVDPTLQGVAFDSTPDIFDSQIFVEVQLRGTLFPGKDGANQGEVQAAIAGTLRLQSDHDFARDSATDCLWQSFVNNQQAVTTKFGAAMSKLALVGQNQANLIDCSDVIPPAIGFTGTAHFPPSLSNKDVEQACATASFPVLSTLPGPPTTIPPIPQAGAS